MNKWYVGILVLLLILVCTCRFPAEEGVATEKEKRNPSTSHEVAGKEACKSCHADIYQSYLQSGMGKSFSLPTSSDIIEDVEENSIVYDPYKDFYYHPYWEKDRMFIKEFRLQGEDTIYQRVEQVNYIIGSGNQTRSYLLNRNGYVYEFPITWYVEKQLWDLSPGYDKGNNSRFSRPINEECLSCHTGSFQKIAGSVNRYRELSLGIDCENCHGPGAAHVERMSTGKGDIALKGHAIINPSNLPLTAQFDVCLQCHLEGVQVFHPPFKSARDFQIGMKLNEVMEVYLPQTQDIEEFGTASHAERLKQSRCFIASEGTLTCTTCHDPHKSSASFTPLDYSLQCMNCHTSAIITEHNPVIDSLPTDCISCHMPKGGTKDIPHVQFHDHKIRILSPKINDEQEKSLADINAEKEYMQLICATSLKAEANSNGKAWLAYYERYDRQSSFLDSAQKYLSDYPQLGVVKIAFYRKEYEKAWNVLSQSIDTTEKELEIMFLKGEILEQLGKYQEAAVMFQQTYRQYPENIEAGSKWVVNYLQANVGNVEVLPEVRDFLDTLLANKPFDQRLLTNRGFVSMNMGRLKEAATYFDQALTLDPDYQLAKENMSYVDMLLGHKDDQK